MSSAAGVARVVTSYAVISATMPSARRVFDEILAARSSPTFSTQVLMIDVG